MQHTPNNNLLIDVYDLKIMPPQNHEQHLFNNNNNNENMCKDNYELFLTVMFI